MYKFSFFDRFILIIKLFIKKCLNPYEISILFYTHFKYIMFIRNE